jgi:hypothetical protein
MINTKIYDHLKKNSNKENSYLNRLFSSSISSSICLLFSYPFELAHTRITSDMTRYGHKKLNSSVIELFTKLVVEEEGKNYIIYRYIAVTKSTFSNLGIVKLYKGISIALVSNVIYWTLTLSMFDKMNNYFENKKERYGSDYEYLPFMRKILILFGATTLNAIFTSAIVYPLDTFKRHIQVNGSLGFKSDYYSLTHGFKMFYNEGALNMYRYN